MNIYFNILTDSTQYNSISYFMKRKMIKCQMGMMSDDSFKKEGLINIGPIKYMGRNKREIKAIFRQSKDSNSISKLYFEIYGTHTQKNFNLYIYSTNIIVINLQK